MLSCISAYYYNVVQPAIQYHLQPGFLMNKFWSELRSQTSNAFCFSVELNPWPHGKKIKGLPVCAAESYRQRLKQEFEENSRRYAINNL